jgi:hypothetical protein
MNATSSAILGVFTVALGGAMLCIRLLDSLFFLLKLLLECCFQLLTYLLLLDVIWSRYCSIEKNKGTIQSSPFMLFEGLIRGKDLKEMLDIEVIRVA